MVNPFAANFTEIYKVLILLVFAIYLHSECERRASENSVNASELPYSSESSEFALNRIDQTCP